MGKGVARDITSLAITKSRYDQMEKQSRPLSQLRVTSTLSGITISDTASTNWWCKRVAHFPVEFRYMCLTKQAISVTTSRTWRQLVSAPQLISSLTPENKARVPDPSLPNSHSAECPSPIPPRPPLQLHRRPQQRPSRLPPVSHESAPGPTSKNPTAAGR